MPNPTYRALDSRKFYYRFTKKLKSFSDGGVPFGPKYSTHKMEAFPQRDTHKSGVFSKVIECLEQNIRK